MIFIGWSRKLIAFRTWYNEPWLTKRGGHVPGGMRRSRRQEQALEELRSSPRATAAETRRQVLRVVEDLGEAEASLWYLMSEVEGIPTLTDFEADNLSAHQESIGCGMREQQIGWATGDPRRPPLGWTRSFVSLEAMFPRGGSRSFRESGVYRHVLRPARINDQMRLLVYAGERFVGWLGGLRFDGSPGFQRADARRLQPVKEALATGIVRADALERAERLEEACDLLVRPGGKIDFASAAGRRWLARPDRRRLVRAWARKLERGAGTPRHLGGWPLRWSRLYDGSRVRYLLHLQPPSPILVAPLDRLTEAQREVAELAASGATTREIARLTGRAYETVRTHLREAYRQLGVSTRAELARLVAKSQSA